MNSAPPPAFRRRSLGAASRVFAALFLCFLVPTLGGASQVGDSSSGATARAFSSMAPRLRRHLDEAFALASLRLQDVATCRELFADLDHPAERSLTDTLYVPASGIQEERICRRRVAAFTEVGSRVTYLCRGFGSLAVRRAATTLVHEALHLAGLEEAPRSRDALTSAEINGLVGERCEL